MKKIKCLDCDKEFVAETSEEALNQMHPHYMEEHKEEMSGGTEEKRKAWFEDFNKSWESAEEA